MPEIDLMKTEAIGCKNVMVISSAIFMAMVRDDYCMDRWMDEWMDGGMNEWREKT